MTFAERYPLIDALLHDVDGLSDELRHLLHRVVADELLDLAEVIDLCVDPKPSEYTRMYVEQIAECAEPDCDWLTRLQQRDDL